MARLDEVSRLVCGFMAYLQQSNLRGHKYKGAPDHDFGL